MYMIIIMCVSFCYASGIHSFCYCGVSVASRNVCNSDTGKVHCSIPKSLLHIKYIYIIKHADVILSLKILNAEHSNNVSEKL